MGESFQGFEADFPQIVNLKMLNLADYIDSLINSGYALRKLTI